MMASDLSTTFLRKKMKNPLVLASGILGVTKKSLEAVAEAGAGAVTTKSISPEPRIGHETPILADTGCGLINAVGYSNPGIRDGISEFANWNRPEQLIVSITGKDEKEFGRLAAAIQDEKKRLNICAVELALSCPHTPGYGLMAGQGGAESVAAITKAVVARTRLPVIVKLSPSVPGEVEAALAAEKAGAAAINMGNTLGPGMLIDIERRRPVLSFRMGGLSGPAIRPVAVRCVYYIYESVKIPIIGTGGVSSGRDAVEMLMAGASLVGVGTAAYYRGRGAFREIAREMGEWMAEHGVKRVSDLVGVAHE